MSSFPLGPGEKREQIGDFSKNKPKREKEERTVTGKWSGEKERWLGFVPLSGGKNGVFVVGQEATQEVCHNEERDVLFFLSLLFVLPTNPIEDGFGASDA